MQSGMQNKRRHRNGGGLGAMGSWKNWGGKRGDGKNKECNGELQKRRREAAWKWGENERGSRIEGGGGFVIWHKVKRVLTSCNVWEGEDAGGLPWFGSKGWWFWKRSREKEAWLMGWEVKMDTK